MNVTILDPYEADRRAEMREIDRQLTRQWRLSDARAALDRLGYGIALRQTDCFGNRWRYRTSPTRSGGPTNYFDSLADLERYAKNVAQVRAWQGVS